MNHWENIVPSRETPGARARMIAQDVEHASEKGDPSELRVLKIRNALKERGLLEQEVARIKSLFKAELGPFARHFGNDCWEMLTVLELFDEETAWHCVDTYEIARNKVEKTLWNGLVLADEFHAESVDLGRFYRACLLHDVGKIEVPHAVLVNRVTDERCAAILFQHQDDVLLPRLREKLGDNFSLPKSVDSPGALLQFLYDDLHLRPQAVAPIKLLLDEQSVDDGLSEQLAHCGCTPDDSLLDIMRTHDTHSEKILSHLGYTVEGKLAGSHHQHKNGEHRYRITIGSLQVSIDLADIVHLADVENAILSRRHYKDKQTPIDALRVLSLHARQGLVEGYVAYLWIADEMQSINRQALTGSEIAAYDSLVSFLDTERSHHLGWPDWRTTTMEMRKAAA